jgi:GTPase
VNSFYWYCNLTDIFKMICFGLFSIHIHTQVTVSSLRLNNVPVRYATAGQTVTLKLREQVSGQEEQALDSTSFVAKCGRRRSGATGLVLLSAPAPASSQQKGTLNAKPVAVDPIDTIITTSSNNSSSSSSNSAGEVAGVGVEEEEEEKEESDWVPPVAHWEFDAELLVLNHPSKIRVSAKPSFNIFSSISLSTFLLE